MAEIPNDVVELIIAVDLNPTDPEEPINVKDVKVAPEGEEGEGGDWQKLVMQLLMGDPASGVTSDGISYDEAVDAVARVLGKEEAPEEPDAFSKAGREPLEKPERPFPPQGDEGMKSALDRALGRKKDEEEE